MSEPGISPARYLLKITLLGTLLGIVLFVIYILKAMLR